MFYKANKKTEMRSTRASNKTRTANPGEYYFAISDTPAAEGIKDSEIALYHPSWGDGIYVGNKSDWEPYDPHNKQANL